MDTFTAQLAMNFAKLSMENQGLKDANEILTEKLDLLQRQIEFLIAGKISANQMTSLREITPEPVVISPISQVISPISQVFEVVSETVTKSVSETVTVTKSKRNVSPEGRAKMTENGKRVAALNKLKREIYLEFLENAKLCW